MIDTPRIHNSIEINASAETVWKLVSEPGWWINGGEYRTHLVETVGNLNTVHDDEYGAFLMETVSLEEPRRASFRWHSDPTDADSPATLVVFDIADRDGGVTLSVTETGFETLPGSDDDRRNKLADNTEGWPIELDVARDVIASW